MVGFVLTGHGDFATGLASSVAMIAGEQPAFDVVPFHEDAAGEYPELIISTIKAAAEKYDGVVVFCDLQGGTPFNQSMLATQEAEDVEVVSGTNLPMLLEVLVTRTENSTTQELVDLALEAGREGVSHMVLNLDATSAEDDDEEGL